MKTAYFLLLLCALACTSNRPDCTIRETSPGVFAPYGNCDNCTNLSVIDAFGTPRGMTPYDMDRYVQQYPPSATYSPQSASLSDWILYHHLMAGPRATHYQTVYVNQARGYRTYRTAHPGFSAPSRFVRHAPTTRVYNNKTIINNNRATSSRPMAYSSPGYRRSSRTTISPSPSRFGSSSPSRIVSRSSASPSTRSYSSASRRR